MARFEIWYGDDRGQRLALLSQVSSFNYFKVLNDVGVFSLLLPLSFDRSLIRKDARIEIWRAFAGGRLYLDFLGFLRKYRYATDQENRTVIELSGPDQNHLIQRRYVLYYSGQNKATASNEYADDLCKRIMRENHGSSATDTDRDWSSLGLTVAPDLATAPQVSLDFYYKNVLETCQEVAELSRQKGTPLYFGIAPLSPTALQFQTKINQWGLDRTTAGVQGTIGLEFGNLAEPSLEVDWFDEATHMTALGQGEGSAQVVRTAQDDGRIGESAWGLIEGIANAKAIKGSTGVEDKARAELELRRGRRRFSGRIVPTKGFVYGRDWGLGDKLTRSYFEQGTGIVRSVRVSVDSQMKETIEARLETEE